MPSKEEAIEAATSLMAGFAERTGLTSDRPKRRYLWTDAFAVCNFLGLARLTGEERYTDLAVLFLEIPLHDESAVPVHVDMPRRVIGPPGDEDEAATADLRHD